MDELDDRELAARCARRDREAVAILYDRHAGLVLACVRRALSKRRAQDLDAEDLAHDVFVDLLDRSLAGFRGDSSLRTFVWSVAFRTSMDAIRSRIRRGTDELPTGRRLVDGRGDRPDAPAEVADDVGAMLRCLDQLQGRCRTLLEERFMNGRTPEEIGGLLKIVPNTVSQSVGRCLRRLRACMHAEDAES